MYRESGENLKSIFSFHIYLEKRGDIFGRVTYRSYCCIYFSSGWKNLRKFLIAVAVIALLAFVYNNFLSTSQIITGVTPISSETSESEHKEILEKYEEAEDYKSAIQYMNDNELASDDTFRDVYVRCANNYVNIISAEVDQLIQDLKIEEANVALNEAMSLLPDNDVLVQLYEDLPQSLFHTQEFIGDIGEFVDDNDGTPDNTGEFRPYRIYCSNYQTHISGYQQATYKLNGEFNRLEFTLALSSKNNDTSYHAWIEFSSNGNLIQSTDRFTAGSSPAHYSIPLTGVDQLEVTVRYDSSSYSIGFVDLLATEFWLIK